MSAIEYTNRVLAAGMYESVLCAPGLSPGEHGRTRRPLSARDRSGTSTGKTLCGNAVPVAMKVDS